MLKASGTEGAQRIHDIIQDTMQFGKIPTKWEESIIVSLYMGKGVTLEQRNYRGLKLIDQVMMVLERVAENLWQVCIDGMQFGFMPGRSMTDVITRHCTWPLSIWKMHYIMYPDVLYGGLFASSAWSGWCGSYRTCMKMPEAECVLVATWVKSSLWKRAFISALVWSPYYSSWFWKPSPKSFKQDVHGKTCMRMTWSSSLNRWMNCKRSWSSGRPTL